MSLIVRPIEQNDAESCGKIGYEAHKSISSAHGYPCEQPSEGFGIGLARREKISIAEETDKSIGFGLSHSRKFVFICVVVLIRLAIFSWEQSYFKILIHFLTWLDVVISVVYQLK